jgi:hypothetical protein
MDGERDRERGTEREKRRAVAGLKHEGRREFLIWTDGELFVLGKGINALVDLTPGIRKDEGMHLNEEEEEEEVSLVPEATYALLPSVW